MSDGDQAISLLYLLGCLVLVVSGLAVSRLPLGQTLKMALAWVLIFAAGFVIFALRDDFRALGGRLLAEIRGEAIQETQGGELHIRRAEDGHFWVDARINGDPIRFMVDSGATITSLTRADAERTGVQIRPGFGVMVQTANGVVTAERGRVERLTVGPIERADMPVHILPEAGNTNLLGMNFLSSLSGWRVEGSTLVLQP